MSDLTARLTHVERLLDIADKTSLLAKLAELEVVVQREREAALVAYRRGYNAGHVAGRRRQPLVRTP